MVMGQFNHKDNSWGLFSSVQLNEMETDAAARFTWLTCPNEMRNNALKLHFNESTQVLAGQGKAALVPQTAR